MGRSSWDGRQVGSELSEGRALQEAAKDRPALQKELPLDKPDGEGIEAQSRRLGQVAGHQGIDLPLAEEDWILAPRLAGVPQDDLSESGPGGRGVGPAPVEGLEVGLLKDVAGQEEEAPDQGGQEGQDD